MLPRPARLFAPALLASAIFLSAARADTMVAVQASASSQYLKRRPEDSPRVPETYIFMQGEFFGGSVRDRGLEKTPFSTIARALAVNLRQNDYVPAKSVDAADLILVAHWGVTIGRQRDHEMELNTADRGRQLVVDHAAAVAREGAGLLDAAPSDDESKPEVAHFGASSLATQQALNFELLERSTETMTDAVRNQNPATLLGFAPDLRADEKGAFASERTKTLLSLIEEDRYFVIIIAYDLRRFMNEKTLVRLWTSRMSIRSAGVNFPTALERMGQIGAQTFGTAQIGLRMKRAKRRTENITIGEAITIEYAPATETEKSEE